MFVGEDAMSVVAAAEDVIEGKLTHDVSVSASVIFKVIGSDFLSDNLDVSEFATDIEGTKFGEMTRVKLKQFGVCHDKYSFQNNSDFGERTIKIPWHHSFHLTKRVVWLKIDNVKSLDAVASFMEFLLSKRILNDERENVKKIIFARRGDFLI